MIIKCAGCGTILARLAEKEPFRWYEFVLYVFRLRIVDTVFGRVTEIVCDCGLRTELKPGNAVSEVQEVQTA